MLRINDIVKKLYEHNPYLGNLLFIDVETTGLEKDAKLIEIGAIATHFDGFDVHIKTFEELINPGVPIIGKITEITGITNEMLSTARGDEVYSDFYEWLKKINPNKMIAHNAVFDEGKLKYNLFRLGYDDIFPEFDCTMRIARKTLNKVTKDNLKALSEHFNFKNTEAHRALADTEVCAYIYCKMLLGEYE